MILLISNLHSTHTLTLKLRNSGYAIDYRLAGTSVTAASTAANSRFKHSALHASTQGQAHGKNVTMSINRKRNHTHGPPTDKSETVPETPKHVSTQASTQERKSTQCDTQHATCKHARSSRRAQRRRRGKKEWTCDVRHCIRLKLITLQRLLRPAQ